MKFIELYNQLEQGQLIRVFVPMSAHCKSLEVIWHDGQSRDAVIEMDDSDLSEFVLFCIMDAFYSQGERDSVLFVKTNNNDLKECV